jgi:hypothetical protein
LEVGVETDPIYTGDLLIEAIDELYSKLSLLVFFVFPVFAFEPSYYSLAPLSPLKLPRLAQHEDKQLNGAVHTWSMAQWI